MKDRNNPASVSAAVFRTNSGHYKVIAIYEVHLQPDHYPVQGKVTCSLVGGNNQSYTLVGTPHIVNLQPQDEFNVYQFHVQFVSTSIPLKDPNRIDPGIKGIEDFTFSINYNMGSGPTPPSNNPVSQELPVIEIDPCFPLTDS